MKKLLTISFSFLALHLATAQNVGIGTSNPQSRLDVVGAIRADSLLLHADTSEGTVLSLTVPDIITFAQNLQSGGFAQTTYPVAQSITAAVSDTLHYISVFTSGPIEADTIRIYEGAGIDGLLLATATMEDGAGWVKSSLLNLYLEEGEQYTFWLNNINFVHYTLDDAYPGGGTFWLDSTYEEIDLTFSLNHVGDQAYQPVHVTGQGEYPSPLPSPFPGVQMELNGHLSVTSLSMANAAGEGSIMTGDSAGNFSWRPSVWTKNQLGYIHPTSIGNFIGIGTTTPNASFHISGFNSNMQIGDYGEPGNLYPLAVFGDGQINFEASDGTPRLYMDGNNKNIGIGTYPQPDERLTVAGKLVADEIKLGLGANTGYLLTSDDFGNASWQEPPPELWEQNGNNLSNTTTGNVGIGVTDPSFKLEVNGTGKFYGRIQTDDKIGIGTFPTSPLHVLKNTSGSMAMFEGDDTNPRYIDIMKGTRRLRMGVFDGVALLGSDDNQGTELALQTAGIGRLHIKANGNIGIGTSVPVEKLQVEGTIRTNNFRMVNGGGFLKYMVSDANGNAIWTDPLWIGGGTSFCLANSNASVGLGTCNPVAKLDVLGTVRATQFQMTTNPDIGKVLTSDISGVASWAAPFWLGSGANQYSNVTGNVGIGVQNATEKLHVSGNAIITGTLSVFGIMQSSTTLVTLSGVFSNWGGEYVPTGYFRDKENMVHLQGLIAISTPTSGTTIFTLPQGFRPGATHVFVTLDSNSMVRLDVDSSGNVKIMDIPAEGFISLSGISFRAA